MNQPFVIERLYNADAQTVWSALTDVEKLRSWFFNVSDFQPVSGFEFTFAGKGEKGENYIHLCKVIEVIEGRRLSYSWSYENQGGYSVVTWELIPEGQKTKLKLTHEGIESFPHDNPDFRPESFRTGWTYFFDNELKGYFERGN